MVDWWDSLHCRCYLLYICGGPQLFSYKTCARWWQRSPLRLLSYSTSVAQYDPTQSGKILLLQKNESLAIPAGQNLWHQSLHRSGHLSVNHLASRHHSIQCWHASQGNPTRTIYDGRYLDHDLLLSLLLFDYRPHRANCLRSDGLNLGLAPTYVVPLAQWAAWGWKDKACAHRCWHHEPSQAIAGFVGAHGIAHT